MGDFERIFGAGADIDLIIEGINRQHLREQRRSTAKYSVQSKKMFASFQEACAWAMENPGRIITRDPNGLGFIEK